MRSFLFLLVIIALAPPASSWQNSTYKGCTNSVTGLCRILYYFDVDEPDFPALPDVKVKSGPV